MATRFFLPAVAAALFACSKASPGPVRGDQPASRAAPITDAATDAGRHQLVGLERGKVLYTSYCALCHGADGQGYVADQAPALANEELLATASDEFLRHTIAKGRPGTTMSAWSVARGGPLVDDDVKIVVDYLRTWQKRPYDPSVDARTITGSAKRGAPVYLAKCLACHGKDGEGGKYAAIANRQLLAGASDGFLATTIERGRPGTPMPAFADTLSTESVGDLVALLRSWQKPVDAKVELPPIAGALKNVVINPGGPQPDFDSAADFISVTIVKRELDRGATFVLADARAPSDYVEMHLARAISVPFYDVRAYAPQIPKSLFVITYCACPHAESVMARDDFRARGYSRVAVLDEGVAGWRDRGYPMRGGPKP